MSSLGSVARRGVVDAAGSIQCLVCGVKKRATRGTMVSWQWIRGTRVMDVEDGKEARRQASMPALPGASRQNESYLKTRLFRTRKMGGSILGFSPQFAKIVWESDESNAEKLPTQSRSAVIHPARPQRHLLTAATSGSTLTPRVHYALPSTTATSSSVRP